MFLKPGGAPSPTDLLIWPLPVLEVLVRAVLRGAMDDAPVK